MNRFFVWCKTGSTAGRMIFAVILLAFFILFSLFLWFISYLEMKGPGQPGEVVVTIPRGASFDDIAEILTQKKLVTEDIRFKLIAYASGYARTIQAGEFALQGGQTPLVLLEQLARAKSVVHKITIPEGYTVFDIAGLFADEGWCEKEAFIAATRDVAFIKKLGLVDMLTLEGYLYPDTYYLTRMPDPDVYDIISMMVMRFNEVWAELAAESANIQETVILASIVEKETGAAAERPLVASVFHNRLKKKMRLQSDPTVIYGMAQFNGNITRKDLKTPTPYNTYTIPGLPPGPICNPGKDALAAVLHPVQSNYLYFVSKNDGTHYFSESLREHNRAVRKYQKR